MIPIKTLKQERVTLDFHPSVYEKLNIRYKDFNDFSSTLKAFNIDLVKYRFFYNINPYSDTIQKGVHILGKSDSELGIFPESELALKCSEGQAGAENLRKQFYKTIELEQEFKTKLSTEERKLLEICPVYLHFQAHRPNFFFRQILFMQRIVSGVTLGNTEIGFDPEFCKIFNIPSLEQILDKPQFALHLYLDKDKHRQLLKIQTVYLFQRLLRKGIRILSLNQKNVLACKNPETGQIYYVIIDPVVDFFPPISPLYNTLTYNFCT